MSLKYQVFVLTLLCVGLASVNATPHKRQANSVVVAAFNIQTFGVSKMDNPFVVEQLRKILLQFDLVLIQEIRDASETAIYELLQVLNDNTGDPYSIQLSTRLGTSDTYKEQYAYFYRSSKLSVVSTYQAPYGVFERPPYCVRFRPTNTGIPEFGFIGIHTKPENAVVEVDALVDVYNTLRNQWGISNFLFGGDFNSDCSYVTSSDWANIRLRTDSSFRWFIADSADTTVHNTDCAYDRLVGAGSAFIGSVSNAHTYYFDSDFGLTQDQALDVSDHYPVRLTLS